MRILKNFGKRIKPRTLVRVVWEDTIGFSGWKEQENKATRPILIETVSFFLEETEQSVNDVPRKSIHLARSLDEYATPQLGDHMIIPTGCVISVEKLK